MKKLNFIPRIYYDDRNSHQNSSESQFSDHFMLLNVFNTWKEIKNGSQNRSHQNHHRNERNSSSSYHHQNQNQNHNNYRSVHQFCYDNFLSNSTLEMINKTKQQISEIFQNSFNSPPTSSSSSDHQDREGESENNFNYHVLSQVLMMGLYPKIFKLIPPKTNHNRKRGYQQPSLHKCDIMSFSYLTNFKQLKFHPSSLLSILKNGKNQHQQHGRNSSSGIGFLLFIFDFILFFDSKKFTNRFISTSFSHFLQDHGSFKIRS